MKLALTEEQKIATRPGYRTPARTLRRLAAAPMLFEFRSSSTSARKRTSAAVNWDRFEVRNLGFKIQRLMARKFGGNATRVRQESARIAAQTLGIDRRKWKESELKALDDLALVLALIPDLRTWSAEEKQLGVRIIRAKATSEESQYLRLMQQHGQLRAAMIKLGSSSSS